VGMKRVSRASGQQIESTYRPISPDSVLFLLLVPLVRSFETLQPLLSELELPCTAHLDELSQMNEFGMRSCVREERSARQDRSSSLALTSLDAHSLLLHLSHSLDVELIAQTSKLDLDASESFHSLGALAEEGVVWIGCEEVREGQSSGSKGG